MSARSDGVLVGIASSRANHLRDGRGAPFIAHLSKRRAAELKRELDHLGAWFGIPLSGWVPEPRDERWTYLGLVLEDVHVFERMPKE